MDMKVEKITTTRVWVDEEFYCDITPSADGYYDFWLFREGYAAAVYMFGMAVDKEDEAVELAVANAPTYFSEFEENDAE